MLFLYEHKHMGRFSDLHYCTFKKRYIGANQKNFMDKELNQAIMVRSKLRNKFLKLKTKQSRLAYAK